MAKKSEMVTWAIPNFPRRVKDRFMGLAKMAGMTAREALEYVALKWIREQERRDGK